MDEGVWWAIVHGVASIGHDWATSLSLSCAGEGNGNPLQCLELITSSITLNLYLGALFISGFGFGRL